jgi:hypothetical protein
MLSRPIALTAKVSPTQLKDEWLNLLNRVENEVAALPGQDLGCIFLGPDGKVIQSLDIKQLSGKLRHYGSVGGAWPRIVG